MLSVMFLNYRTKVVFIQFKSQIGLRSLTIAPKSFSDNLNQDSGTVNCSASILISPSRGESTRTAICHSQLCIQRWKYCEDSTHIIPTVCGIMECNFLAWRLGWSVLPRAWLASRFPKLADPVLSPGQVTTVDLCCSPCWPCPPAHSNHPPSQSSPNI